MIALPVPPAPEFTGPVTVTFNGTVYLRRTVFGVNFWTVA